MVASLSQWRTRLRSLWSGVRRRDDVEARMAEEFRLHQELRAADLIRAGLSPAEAARQARLEFGSPEHYKDEGRKARGLARVDRIWASWLDVKLGFRMLAKHPGLTVIGGLALAGAIGIGAARFELSREQLYPRLPLDEGNRVVRLQNWDTRSATPTAQSLDDLTRWREELRSIVDLGAYRPLKRNVSIANGLPEPMALAEVTASAFRVARVPPQIGRVLLDADQRPGAPPVVVIGYDVWQQRFGGDPSALGRTLQLGDMPAVVVGVMPKGFAFPINHRLWVPLQVDAAYGPGQGPAVEIFGRLAPDATMEQAQAELSAAGERAGSDRAATHRTSRPRVLPYAGPPPARRDALEQLIINAAVLLILIAAAANVATLVYARTATREIEMAIRTALGASRSRIVMQLFVESLVLATAATLAGLAGAHLVLTWMSRWQIAALGGEPPPFWADPGLSWPTIVYGALLAIVGAALVCLLPAIKVTGRHVHGTLQNLSTGSRLRFGGIWTAVIVVQVALTVLCLPLAIGLTSETFNDRLVRSRFPTASYLSARLELDRERPLDPSTELAPEEYKERLAVLYGELERRLEEEPGVRAVTFGDRLPGMVHRLRVAEVETTVPGAVLVAPDVWSSSVALDFFDAFQVPLAAGRAFSAGDLAPTSRAVLVNQGFVRIHLGEGNPLGRRVRYAAHGDDPAGPWHEIVGVVRDLGMNPTHRGEAPFVFHPATPHDAYPPYVAVHASGDPSAIAPRLRGLAAELDGGLRLQDVLPLDTVALRTEAPQILGSVIVAGAVLLALVLAAAGIFSLMALSVSRRTREIGVRLALGATHRRVLAAVFARAALQIGAGLVAGNLPHMLIAWTLPDLAITDIAGDLVVTSAAMLLVGFLACAAPARRALRIEPTQALKET